MVTAFSYDPLGQVSRTAFGVGTTPDGGPESTIDRRYDAAGRVTEVVDSAYGTVRLAYDPLGRVTAVEDSAASTVRYGYDEAGRRTTMTVGDGPETTYRYGDGGALTEVARGDAAVHATRDEAGRVVDLALPHGVTAAYAYDDAAALTGISWSSDSDDDVATLGYRLDGAGRRSGFRGSLASTALPDPVGSATYDAANRLTSWDGRDLRYDAGGYLVEDGINTYTWDARGQLAAVSGPGSQSYAYDPFGRRASVTTDGVTTRATYDGLNLVREVVGEGAAAEAVDYLGGLAPDEIYARLGGGAASDGGDGTPGDGGDASRRLGGPATYLTDGLGSTLALIGEDGELGARWDRTPFGGTLTLSDEADAVHEPVAVGFAGRAHDATGLIQMRARYYHPTFGRFISPDPLGHGAGDPNHYAYAGGDPVDNTDPSGLCLDSALDTIMTAFSLTDDAVAVMDAERRGQITRDQAAAASDEITRQARALGQNFAALCGAELAMGGLIPYIRGGQGMARGLGRGHLTPRGTSVARYDPDFAIGQIARGGQARASDLVDFGASQGWRRTQTAGGPIKFVDDSGVTRLTIKSGSPRAPGSGAPHIEIRNAAGQRIDVHGNLVTRRSLGNHTSIIWDLVP